MIPLVYLIGKEQKGIEEVNRLLGGSCDIKNIAGHNLMIELMSQPPSCIVLLDDEQDEDSIAVVEAALNIEYMPVIALSITKEDWQMDKRIENASIVGKNTKDTVLEPLVIQSQHFSGQYHNLQRTMDTYDVLNDEVKNMVESYYNRVQVEDYDDMLDFMTAVYSNNEFVENKPGQVWIVREEDGVYKSVELDLVNREYLNVIEFVDVNFDINYYKETGFFKNLGSNEMSDIDDVKQLIPAALYNVTQAINNIAAYSIGNVMVIALNYEKEIEQKDLNIVKAVSIKVDLFYNVVSGFEEVQESFIYTMDALARAAEGKDDVTGFHIKRVNYFSGLIAKTMGMDKKFIDDIQVAAQMHDVGKIFVPESILNKKGKLTDEEFDTIKQHTTQGAVIIGESKNLKMAASIAKSHHEKYDGSGYPEGLTGENIPLEARIVALADIYDALRSPRSYKPGFTHDEAYGIIVKGDGRVEPKHFDPNVLQAFIEEHLEFKHLYDSNADD